MAVELFSEREAVVIKWEPGDYEGEVRIISSAPDGDTSSTILESNAGFAALTFPVGELAPFHVEVQEKETGVLVDEGNVEP
jgi:hypothetical protein